MVQLVWHNNWAHVLQHVWYKYWSPHARNPCSVMREATEVRSPHTITKISPNMPQLEKEKKVKTLIFQSCPTLCTRRTIVHYAPLSMEFSRKEYWSGLLFPCPGDLPKPGIKPRGSNHITGRFFTIWATMEAWA